MTASRGWWVHGALARLQVLLGGMVICHIRFSTTLYTMVVVYIGLRFFPDKIAHLALLIFCLVLTALALNDHKAATLDATPRRVWVLI